MCIQEQILYIVYLHPLIFDIPYMTYVVSFIYYITSYQLLSDFIIILIAYMYRYVLS